MGHEVTLGDAKIYIAEFDISPDMHAHDIVRTIDLKEDTSYGDTFKQRVIGVQDANFNLAGFMPAGGETDSETIIQARMGVQNVPVIIGSSGSAIGDPAEFGLINQADYNVILNHGDIQAFSLNGQIATRKWIRGRVLWSPATVISGTADGAEVELQATSVAQKLYVAIAVIAADLTTMTVKVQSDTTGFASPIDQKTFTAVIDVTAENPTPVDGAIADTFYRVSISVFTGTTAQMVVVAGID